MVFWAALGKVSPVGDPSPPLIFGEAVPGAMYPVLGSLVKKKHKQTGKSPTEDH